MEMFIKKTGEQVVPTGLPSDPGYVAVGFLTGNNKMGKKKMSVQMVAKSNIVRSK